VKRRFKSFLNDLLKGKDETVLIVTHLPILKVARGYFKHLSNESMDALTEKDIPNCTVFRFTAPAATSKRKS
jgi:broad specificity phosphatase PhoE